MIIITIIKSALVAILVPSNPSRCDQMETGLFHREEIHSKGQRSLFEMQKLSGWTNAESETNSKVIMITMRSGGVDNNSLSLVS